MYDYNLVVSYSRGLYWMARREAMSILNRIGDDHPVVRRTMAAGIMGINTSLDPKEVTKRLRELFEEDPYAFHFTLKWVPIERWTSSDLDSMKEVIEDLASRIGEGETWRMTVEKRRYNRLHKIEIIRELAELIDRKVNLENPDKIVRIDIFGNQAGISILKPGEVFSSTKPYR